MRTLRLSMTAMLSLVLLAVLGGTAGAQYPQGAVSSDFEVAWAAIRAGVLADRAEWEARFDALDLSDEGQVGELRRALREQQAVLDGLGLVDADGGYRIRCLWEAHYAAQMALSELRGALAEALDGDPRLSEEYFGYGRESAARYWELRDGVDCSVAGEVAMCLGSRERGSGGNALRPISGTRLEYDYVSSEASIRMEGNAFRVDGDTTYERWEWSDPLLPPDLTNRINMANFGAGWDGMVIVASLLFEGPEGYWIGTGQGRTWVLTGHGAYEGLSAILTTSADTDADTLTVEGALYAGPLPEVPAPIEPGPERAAELYEDAAVPPPTEEPAVPA